MKRRQTKPGFTVAEMLLALAVSAMLLTAIATAMHASLLSYKENEQIAAATQTARAVLNRMTRDIRTARAVSHTGDLLRIIPPEDGGIAEIQYERDGSEMIYRVTKNGTQTTYPLVADTDDVTISSFSIAEETGLDSEGLSYIKSLSMRITFEIEGKSFSHVATARPRRNLVY